MERLVLKELVWLLEVLLDALLDRIKDLFIDVALEDICVHLLDKPHQSTQHFLLNSVGVGVRLDLGKHIVVSFPIVLERYIVFDD